MERAHNAVPDKPFWWTAEKVSPVVVECQEVVCSDVVCRKCDRKGHATDIRRRPSNADVRAVPRDFHEVRATRISKAQSSNVNVLTDVASVGKGADSNVIGDPRNSKDRSGLVRQSDAFVDRLARRASATGDIESVSESINALERATNLVVALSTA